MLPLPLLGLVFSLALAAAPADASGGLPGLLAGLRGPLASADRLLAEGRYTEASANLRALLGTRPPPAVAAEAGYKLGAAYLLDGLPEQSSEAFARLTREHGDSFWARLALSSHIDAERLTKLAREAHDAARSTGDRAACEHSLRLWQVVVRRQQAPAGAQGAANGKPAGTGACEALYKIGDACLRLGRTVEGRDALSRAGQVDAKNDWARLAQLRLAGAEGLGGHLSEFFALQSTDKEAKYLYLELAREALPRLEGEAARRGKLLRARALWELERLNDAAEQLREVVQAAGAAKASGEVAEARFWLAEKLFRDGQFTQARDAFHDLARDYPDGPRAAPARAWADGLDELTDRWREVTQALERAVASARSGQGGIGLRMDFSGPGVRQPYQTRLAFQDADHVWISMTQGGTSWLMANNAQGGWVQMSGQPLTRLRKKHAMPMPDLRFNVDPVSRQTAFFFNFGTQPGGRPQLNVPAETPGRISQREMSMTHLGRSRRTGPDGQPVTVFLLERADWEPTGGSGLEAEVSGQGRIARVCYRWRTSQGLEKRLTLSDISLGEPVPEEAFAVTPPAGASIAEAEEVSVAQTFGQLMQLMFTIMGEFGDDSKK